MNYPQKIIVHHTAVSYDKNPNQFDATDAYHKRKGWGGIGYHYLIEKNGKVRVGRKESTAGAHCSQSLMNYRSIGICLTGNFDGEEPTQEQCESLLKLIREVQGRYKIKDKDVLPHRHYATYKSCWGTKLPNDIIGYLIDRVSQVTVQPISDWALPSVTWAKEKGIATKWEHPQEIVANADAESMMHRAGLISELTGKGISKERLAVILYKLAHKL